MSDLWIESDHHLDSSQTSVERSKSNGKQGSPRCQLGGFSPREFVFFGAEYSEPLVSHPVSLVVTPPKVGDPTQDPPPLNNEIHPNSFIG